MTCHDARYVIVVVVLTAGIVMCAKVILHELFIKGFFS